MSEEGEASAEMIVGPQLAGEGEGSKQSCLALGWHMGPGRGQSQAPRGPAKRTRAGEGLGEG